MQRSCHGQFFKQCVKSLLQGRMLSVEEVADILSLKKDASDLVSAMQLVRDSQVCHFK